MSERETWYRWQGETLVLSVRVQPRSRKDELISSPDGQLKARITAPPVEGRANDYLRRFLAKEFAVPQSRIELVAGARSRIKRIHIRAPHKLPAAIATSI